MHGCKLCNRNCQSNVGLSHIFSQKRRRLCCLNKFNYIKIIYKIGAIHIWRYNRYDCNFWSFSFPLCLQLLFLFKFPFGFLTLGFFLLFWYSFSSNILVFCSLVLFFCFCFGFLFFFYANKDSWSVPRERYHFGT